MADFKSISASVHGAGRDVGGAAAAGSAAAACGGGNDYGSRMTRVLRNALRDTPIGGTAPVVSLVGAYAATKLLVSLCALSARELRTTPLPRGANAADEPPADAPTDGAAAAPAGAAAAASPPAKPGAWRSKRVQQLQQQTTTTAVLADAAATAAPAVAEKPLPQRCVCVIRDAYTLDCVARFFVDDEPPADADPKTVLKPNAYTMDVWAPNCWIVVCGPATYADAHSSMPQWSRTVKLFEYGCWDDDGTSGHAPSPVAVNNGLISVRKVLEFVAPLRPWPAHELRSIEQAHELSHPRHGPTVNAAAAAAAGADRAGVSESTRVPPIWEQALEARRVGDDNVPMCFSLAPDQYAAWSGTAQPLCLLQRASVDDRVPGFAGYGAYAAAVATGHTNAVQISRAAADGAARQGDDAGAAGGAGGALTSPTPRVTLAIALLDHVLLYDVAGLLHVLAAKQHEREEEDGDAEADGAAAKGSADSVSLGILNPLSSHWDVMRGYAAARAFITQLVRQPTSLSNPKFGADCYVTLTLGGVTRQWQPPVVGIRAGAVAAPKPAPAGGDAKVAAGAAADHDADDGDGAAAAAADAKQPAAKKMVRALPPAEATTQLLLRRDMAMGDVPNTLMFGGAKTWVKGGAATDAAARTGECGSTLIGSRFGQLFVMDAPAHAPAGAPYAHTTYSLRSAAVCGVSVVDLDIRQLFARMYGTGPGVVLPLTRTRGEEADAKREAAATGNKALEALAASPPAEKYWFRTRVTPVLLYPYNPHDLDRRTPAVMAAHMSSDAAAAPPTAVSITAAAAARMASGGMQLPLVAGPFERVEPPKVRGLDADDDELVRAADAAARRAASDAAAAEAKSAAGAGAGAGAAAATAGGGPSAAKVADALMSSPLAVWAPGMGDDNKQSQDPLLASLRVAVVMPGGATTTGWRSAAQRYYRLVRVDSDSSTIVAQRTGRIGLCVLRMAPLPPPSAATRGVAPVLTYEVCAVTDTLKAQDFAFALAE